MNLKDETILERKPNLCICSNHRVDERTERMVKPGLHYAHPSIRKLQRAMTRLERRFERIPENATVLRDRALKKAASLNRRMDALVPKSAGGDA